MDSTREQLRVTLIERASTLFGESRARAIEPGLEERAEHLAKVAAVRLSEDDEPAPSFTPLRHPHERTTSTPIRGEPATPGVERAAAASPSELLSACLERIDSLDGELRAWAAVDRERAIATARELDQEPRAGPLHGVPVAVKDNIATAGLSTRAGSPLYEGHVPPVDATAVSRVRQAGAVVLGKTASTELAANDPAPTRNPWNPAHTPGGSSPGSAVAVATGMALASVDTQTAGDVLPPPRTTASSG